MAVAAEEGVAVRTEHLLVTEGVRQLEERRS